MKETNTPKGLHSKADDLLHLLGYNSEDNFYYVALLSAPILLTVYRYFTEAQDFINYFPALAQTKNGEVYAYILEYGAFFMLFLAVPYFIMKYYNKEHLLLEFTRFPRINKSLAWVLLVICIYVVFSAYTASSMESILQEYPLPRSLLTDQGLLWLYLLAYLLLYYLPWEFFFRGFLLFGLKNKYGIVAAILIQTISSCLVHIDKPAVEILGSIPFGIVFGIIAIKTRSIWLLVLLHALLGILTDLFIIF